MSKTLITILILIPVMGLAQIPYSWSPGVNPGWISSNGTLSWKPGCSVVTTNCTGNYANNTISSYTSPVINTTCSYSSTVAITFTASGSAEYGFDFLFIEYSLNGGATWINPYGAGIGWTGNFGSGSTIPAVSVPASTTFIFRFRFESDGTFRDIGYKITDFDINCLAVLPVELISFTGSKSSSGNVLKWEADSEVNSDKYTVEKSTDGYMWETIHEVDSDNSYSYTALDTDVRPIINYYRLSQIDNDGYATVYQDKIVVIDNRRSEKEVIGIVNVLGQNCRIDAPGIVIIQYSDGSIEKRYN